jgi:hypothetical protein
MRFTALGLVPFTFLLLSCGDDDGSSASVTTQAEAVVDPADEATDETSGADSGTDVGSSGRTGLVATADGNYAFAPSTCVIFGDEVEVGGPGTAPDGGPVFISMDAGEGYANLRIDLGTDDEFTSGSEFMISGDLTFALSGSTVSGSAALRNGAGGPDSTEVTFEVDCG